MYLLKTLVQTFVVFGAIPAVLIFGLAGRWDLWNVWAYVAILIGVWHFQAVAVNRKSPDLLKERIKPATGGRDGKFLVIYVLVILIFILHWGSAGLDQRFHWTDRVPLAGMVAGLAIFAIGLGLTTWSMLVNSFFSTAVRIQEDRGQRVISDGPYAIVRHPGYSGALLALIASGVALNSLLAIIPAVIVVAVMVRRTAIEDRMLHDDLSGYADYSAKVRYRLIPALW